MTELTEKCRLTDEEILESCRKAWDEDEFGMPFPEASLYDNALAIPMLNDQLAKAIPIISAEALAEAKLRQLEANEFIRAEARKQERERIYRWLCVEWKEIDGNTAIYRRSDIDRYFGQALKQEGDHQ